MSLRFSKGQRFVIELDLKLCQNALSLFKLSSNVGNTSALGVDCRLELVVLLMKAHSHLHVGLVGARRLRRPRGQLLQLL